jgi:hypothetical protein
MATFLGAALAGTSATALAQTSPAPSTTTGGATPEDAVSAYVSALAAGDVDGILAASAVDEMADGFDFEAYTERLQALALMTSMAPAEYPMFRTVNRYQQAGMILGQVRSLVYQLLSDERIDGAVIAPVDAERIAAFVAAVDPSQLAGLSIVDVGLPEPDVLSSQRYIETVKGLAAAYGADEMTERLALIDLGGETYGLGFTLLRYGDDWLVSSQSSPIGGTSSLGTAEPMTQAEFDERTGG